MIKFLQKNSSVSKWRGMVKLIKRPPKKLLNNPLTLDLGSVCMQTHSKLDKLILLSFQTFQKLKENDFCTSLLLRTLYTVKKTIISSYLIHTLLQWTLQWVLQYIHCKSVTMFKQMIITCISLDSEKNLKFWNKFTLIVILISLLIIKNRSEIPRVTFKRTCYCLNTFHWICQQIIIWKPTFIQRIYLLKSCLYFITAV